MESFGLSIILFENLNKVLQQNVENCMCVCVGGLRECAHVLFSPISFNVRVVFSTIHR